MARRTPRQLSLPIEREAAQAPPEAPPRRDYNLPHDYGEGLDIPAPGGVPAHLRIPLIDD